MSGSSSASSLIVAPLPESEVERRRAEGRGNNVRVSAGRSVRDIIRANVCTRINALLAVLLVLVLSTGSWINAAFGLLIIVNSATGIVQEIRAKRTLDRLAVVGQSRPRLRRCSGEREYPREEVVEGDVIVLGAGDQLVVDGTVLEATTLEVDESMLTGEADPVVKHPGDEVLSGSFVVSGAGLYRADRVGREAYAARLVEEASVFSLTSSELMAGINRILRIITWLLVPVGLLTVYVQLIVESGQWRESVLAMTASLVPMVPEGLVLMTSVAFAVGVIRLGQRQCLVQELPAIEGLARVDVVCADKTGTLTSAGLELERLEVMGEPEDPAAARAAKHDLWAVMAAMVAADERPNASMQAIASALEDSEARPAPQGGPAICDVVPFTSARKFSGISLVAPLAGATEWVLGAPDALAAPGSPAATAADRWGDRGLRVLAIARTSQPLADLAAAVDARGLAAADLAASMETVGLLVLRQQIRPDAAATIGYFHRQRVDVKVISGDNARSVAAVTRDLGLSGDTALDARTLPDPESGPKDDPAAYSQSGPAADDAFAQRVENATVIGRVTPRQKESIVRGLQSRGHAVAMTGDGVNDVLALKRADIGVAMGSGAPATRSVAQIVLLNNAFSTLPHVVAEGRRVIGNIERVANLFLTKTVYSIVLALVMGLLHVRFPFQPIHVTITGWFTIGVPAFLLGLAPNHERAQPGFARRVLRLALPSGVIVGAVTSVAYLLARPAGGFPTEEAFRQASTAALAALICSSTWVLAVVARPYRPWKVALIVLSIVAYLVLFTLPLTARLFALDATNPRLMALGLGCGAVGAMLVEAAWWIDGLRRSVPRGWRSVWDTAKSTTESDGAASDRVS